MPSHTCTNLISFDWTGILRWEGDLALRILLTITRYAFNDTATAWCRERILLFHVMLKSRKEKWQLFLQIVYLCQGCVPIFYLSRERERERQRETGGLWMGGI